MSSAEMSSRSLTATLLGVLAGAGGFGALMLAGWLLYRRLWGDSATALLVIVVIFGAGFVATFYISPGLRGRT